MKIDAGFFSFLCVLVCAVPVVILRSKTYNMGYELGQLKKRENRLQERQMVLEWELALLKKKIRENVHQFPLFLPGPHKVFHGTDLPSLSLHTKGIP